MLIQTQPTTNFSSSMSSALTAQSFYEAYCWVVFTRAVGESRMADAWRDLARVYSDFDPLKVNKETVIKAEEWLDSETTLGPSQCALMIQLLGWDRFCHEFVKTTAPKKSLALLRGMDWISIQQLGRLLDLDMECSPGVTK
ncbi:MAG: hypothetical protein WCA07_12915 [Gloeobacterales cyanobacterium]